MTDDRPTIDPRTHPCVCHRGREAARNCPHHTLADYDEADAARDRPTIDRDAQQTAAEGEVSVRSTGVAPAEAVASPSAVPTIDRDDCANCAPRNATTPEAMTTEQMRYAWAGRDPALDALTKYAAQPDTGYSTTVRVPRHLLTSMFAALDAETRRADAAEAARPTLAASSDVIRALDEGAAT